MTHAVPIALRVTPQIVMDESWLVCGDMVSVPDGTEYGEWEMAGRRETPEVYQRMRDHLNYYDKVEQPAVARELTMLALMKEFEISNNSALGLINWERHRQKQENK